MGQLEDLRINRIIRMQRIQKGFCDNDNEDILIKAHNVGDVHPNHPDWVWTQLSNGKYDWRVRKGQAKTVQTPAPKPSGESDFTPKIPSEITRLTNRSDYNDFDNAYRTLGAEIFKEKFPTAADFQKWVNDNPYKGIKTQQEMERYLGREKAGDIVSYRSQRFSKTAQIVAMKKYYEDKAVKEKRVYQEKKNADYWASSEGVKRKSEIKQEIQEQFKIRNKSVSDAISDVQKLFGSNNNEYKIDVRLSDYGDYRLDIKIDNKSRDSLSLEVSRNKDDFKVEFEQSAISYDFNNPDDIKMAQAVFHCGNVIAQNTNKIKDILIKHGDTYVSAGDKINKLGEELDANY